MGLGIGLLFGELLLCQCFKADVKTMLQQFKQPDVLHPPMGAVFFVASKPAGKHEPGYQ